MKPLPGFHCLQIRMCHLMYNSTTQHASTNTTATCNSISARRDSCLLGSFSLQISHIEITHFSSANLTFLKYKFHISPVQISHFSSANFTFLLCKSHISPVQISLFSCTNLTFLLCKSHISPVQISLFSSANLTFLQCKIPPSITCAFM